MKKSEETIRGMASVTPPIALTTAPPEPVPPALTPNLGLQLARPMSKPTWMGTFNGNMSIIDDYSKDEIDFRESILEKTGNITTDVEGLNTEIVNLQQHVSDELTQLNTKVNTIETEISSIDSRLESIEEGGGVDLTEIENKITALETDMAEVKSSVETINTEIADVNEKILENSGLLHEQQNEITALNQKVDNAISGGSIVANFDFNLLQQGYQNSNGNNTISTATATNIQGRSQYPVSAFVRTYNVVNGVKSSSGKPAKLYWTFANSIGSSFSLIVKCNGTQVGSGFSGNGVNINQIVASNPNVTVSFELKDNNSNAGYFFNISISQLRISNH